MARPPMVPTPKYTLDNAIAAAKRIRRLRAEPRVAGRPEPKDPDLAFFPAAVVDDQDVDAVVAYLGAHRRVPAEVLAVELPDRARLVEYQHQRDVAAYKRRVLALLDAGHDLKAPPRTYGPALGLPSRAAVHNRRTRLTIELRRYGQAPPTARQAADDARMDRWLAEHRRELLAVGEALVDNREDLLRLLADPDQRAELAVTIDQVGEMMTARPSRVYASAVAHAMFQLRPGGPARKADDSLLTEAIERGTRLRASFNKVRDGGAAVAEHR